MATIVAAFQTWDKTGLSGLYTVSEDGADRLQRFIEDSKGSYATLHTFASEEEASMEYYIIHSRIYG